jgi:glycosyltransferase involved in cell wall biosynthesis
MKQNMKTANSDNLKGNEIISVIILAKNEENNIDSVLTSVKLKLSKLCYQVIVIDDGSTDRTKDVALSHGVSVISHNINKGKGAAMKTGVVNSNGNIVVFIDGDGAHDPGDILKVVAPIQQGKADMVIGSRNMPGSIIPSSPLRRRLSNNLASQIISITVSYLLPLAFFFNRFLHKCGVKPPQTDSSTQKIRWRPSNKRWITDCTSGFRAIKTKSWWQLELSSDGFEIETEMIFEAIKDGMIIFEVPISCIWDSQSSHLSIIRDGSKTLKLLCFKLFKIIRYG